MPVVVILSSHFDVWNDQWKSKSAKPRNDSINTGRILGIKWKLVDGIVGKREAKEAESEKNLHSFYLKVQSA